MLDSFQKLINTTSADGERNSSHTLDTIINIQSNIIVQKELIEQKNLKVNSMCVFLHHTYSSHLTIYIY